MEINGNVIDAEKFAFDGCHKIYLLNGDNEEREAKSFGYKIYPIIDLIDCFIYTCGLRFINMWNGKSIIPQCTENVQFNGFSIPKIIEKKFVDGKITIQDNVFEIKFN